MIDFHLGNLRTLLARGWSFAKRIFLYQIVQALPLLLVKNLLISGHLASGQSEMDFFPQTSGFTKKLIALISEQRDDLFDHDTR